MPDLDFSSDAYYFRQSSQQAAQSKLVSLGHADAEVVQNPASIVYGQALTRANHHAELPVRLASPQEVRQLASPFSTCTIPLIFHTLWLHNLNEWFVRAPVQFDRYQHLLPRELSITLFSPLKIPVPDFNRIALQPYSFYDVTSFADFSARLPESTGRK